MGDLGLSVCCGAPLRQHDGEEGTQWFTCSECKRPADAAPDSGVCSVVKRHGCWEWLECAECGCVVERDWDRCNCGRRLGPERVVARESVSPEAFDGINFDALNAMAKARAKQSGAA